LHLRRENDEPKPQHATHSERYDGHHEPAANGTFIVAVREIFQSFQHAGSEHETPYEHEE
jgi:hypothetical protein